MRATPLVFFAFEPLIKRKERLERLFNKEIQGLRYSEHVFTDGPRFRQHACKLGLDGIILKRIDRPYASKTATSVRSDIGTASDFAISGGIA